MIGNQAKPGLSSATIGLKSKRRSRSCTAIMLARCAAMGLVASLSVVNAAPILSDMDCVIEPSIVVELGTAVPGLLADSFFDKSDFIEKGTVVAKLESEVERITLAIAAETANSSTATHLREVTAEFGDRTRVRNATLLKSAGISQQVMDQVTTEAEIAKLQVMQEQEATRLAKLEVLRARAMLNRREIRSPIDGTVTRRYKSKGEYVDSEPVYQLAQLDPLHIEVIVPIDYLGSVEIGMSAKVHIDVPGFDNQNLVATVKRIDSVADAASATYGVQLVLENPELDIPSGVRCRVDIADS